MRCAWKPPIRRNGSPDWHGLLMWVLREHHGMTVEAIAAESGLSQSSVRQFERNARAPSRDTERDIAAVFGWTLEEYRKRTERVRAALEDPL